MSRSTYVTLGLVALVLTGWVLPETAHAQGSVSVVTDKPTGTPLVMDAGTVSSDRMVLSIRSDSSTAIQGWQTRLLILPAGGTGSVGIDSTAQPSNYVFGERGGFYTEELNSASDDGRVTALDANLENGIVPVSVTIPSSPGLNLNELRFVASADAAGLFGVFAVGGAGRSEWTDETSGVMLFDNIAPTPDSQTKIGEILVNQIGGTPETVAEETQAGGDDAEIAPTSMPSLCGAGGPLALLVVAVGLLGLRFSSGRRRLKPQRVS